MYLSTIGRREHAAKGKLSAVGANVFALGAVSLVTDVSSEMVTAILPVYLVLGLHLSPAAYGLVDGLYTGATALLRIVGGYVADRVRRRKVVAGAGYALSAVAKLGLLAAGASAAAIGAVITLDRT
ncbi:MFS transporter, partial [Amycolatopsis sp. SID8362]